MLFREITASKIPRRRWYQSSDMDLFVWLGAGGKVERFELTYDNYREEKALVWDQGRFTHTRVDDGARPGRYPQTPIHVADGDCDSVRLETQFSERAGTMELHIAEFIQRKIQAYPTA